MELISLLFIFPDELKFNKSEKNRYEYIERSFKYNFLVFKNN